MQALVILCAVLIVTLLVREHSWSHGDALRASVHTNGVAAVMSVGCDGGCAGPSFWSAAVASGTDKVPPKPHAYQFAYQRYLGPLRCKPLALLEIGLGCGYGPFGAGSSVLLWLTWLPLANVSVFEFDRGCVTKFAQTLPYPLADRSRLKTYAGDQANVRDLEQVYAGGPYDVIVDDGGHSMVQQITSLRTLFSQLKPGGLYFLEDLLTTYFWFDGPWHDEGRGGVTTIAYLNKLSDVLNFPQLLLSLDEARFPGVSQLAELVRSIDCYREICVLSRYDEGEWPLLPPPEPAPGFPSYPPVPPKYVTPPP